MIDLGIVQPGSTIRIPFSSFDKDDGSSITMTNYAAADILIYKDGSTTERASTAGFTATTDFDAKTGKHLAVIDLADNTTAGFYAAGSEYLVAIDAVTVDAVTTGGWIARFCIGYRDAVLNTTIATLSNQTSFTLTAGPAEDDALNGCVVLIHDVASAVQKGFAVVSDYTGASKTVTLVAGTTFTAAASDNISFFPPVNASHAGAVAYSATRGLAGTALPAAAADAAGGLPISDAGGLDLDAKIGALTYTVANKVDANVTHAAGTAWNSGAIGAGTIAADAIGASELATDAVQEIRNAITGGAYALDTDSNGRIRIVDGTAAGEINTNAGAIALVDLVTTVTNLTNAATSGDLTATMKASVNTEVDTGLADINLDHLVKIAVDTDFATTVHLDSVIGYLADAGGTATFDRTTDALEVLGAATAPSAATIADAVWDEALSGHLSAGSTGEALNAAGAAGDPWVTALPGAYGAGSAGFIVGTYLTGNAFTRLGAPAGASVSADIAAVKSDTAATLLDTGTDGVIVNAAGLQTDAVQEVRNAITGGAYALDTDANGRVRIVDGTAAGELNTSGGVVEANVVQWLSSAVIAVTQAGVPKVDAVRWLGNPIVSPAVAGIPSVDLVRVAGATTDVATLATNVAAILADTGTDGVVIGSGAITRATLAADTGLQTIRSNTAQSGSAATITLDASASSTNNFYRYALIYLTGGTGAGQVRLIVQYNGTTKQATIVPTWTTNPSSDTTFSIMPWGPADIEAVEGVGVQSGDDGYISVDVQKLDGDLTAGTNFGAVFTSARFASNYDLTNDLWKTNVSRVSGTAQTAGDIMGTLGSAGDGLTAILNRLPASLVGGRMDSSVGAMAADVLTAAALASDAVNEIRNAITGGAYALNTSATGSIRVVDGTSTDEINTSGGDVSVLASSVRTAVGLAGATLDTDIAALPTAAENAAALLDLTDGIETGVTPRQLLRGVGAALFGLVTGAGSGTEVFKGAGQASGGTTRLTYTVDSSGNRSGVTLNL